MAALECGGVNWALGPQRAGRRGPKWAVERVAWRCLSPLDPSVCGECDPREGERASGRVREMLPSQTRAAAARRCVVHIAVPPDDVHKHRRVIIMRRLDCLCTLAECK